MKRLSMVVLLFFFLASPLGAATMIEIKSNDSISRIYSDGKKARMGMDESGYIIIDPAAGTAHTVIDAQKEVVKITLDEDVATKEAKVDVKVKEAGAGPEIIGYSTMKYDFYINDQFCGSVFSSKKAMEEAQIQPVYTFIQKMTAKMQALSSQFSPQNDPCLLGGAAMTEKVMALGLALKSVEKDGSVSSEIVKIDTKAQLPEKAFVIPEGYQVKDMNQMHESMQQGMKNPDVDLGEMMKKLEESGDMPPEMLEQMKQMHSQQ